MEGSVLVVDDEVEVRESLCEELAPSFLVESACSAEAALALLGETRFDAIVSDVRMPGMNGLELLERAAQIDPSLVCVVLTGYDDDDVYDFACATRAYKLRKPWGDELEITLRNGIAHRRQLDAVRADATRPSGFVPIQTGQDTNVEDIVGHLTRSLRALSWVLGVSVRRVEPGADYAPRHAAAERCAGAADGRGLLVEQTTRIGPTGGEQYSVWIQWDDAHEHASRLVDMTLAQAADALRLQALARELKAQTDELERVHGQIMRTGQLSALGAMTGSFTHDLRSPLAVLCANNEYLAERRKSGSPPDDAELASILEDNGLALDVILGIVDSLRTSTVVPENDGAVLVRDVVVITERILRSRITRAGVRFTADIEGEPLVRGTAAELCQVLMNLVGNALQVSPRGGAIHVSAREETGSVYVRVSDQGPGIASESIGRLFTPFFTTKKEGTGLGLALSRHIARRHGGDLRVAAAGEEAGAVFELVLRPAMQRLKACGS